MTLRPRYSLLTLLLLTAAVAVGVKLWRGPHWAELQDVLKPQDRAELKRQVPLRDFIYGYRVGNVRYQYLQFGDRIIWVYAEGSLFTQPLKVGNDPLILVVSYPWIISNTDGWRGIVFWVADLGDEPKDTAIYLLGKDESVFRMTFEPKVEIQKVPLESISNQQIRNRLNDIIRQLRIDPNRLSIES